MGYDPFPSFDLDTDGVVALIRGEGYRKVLVQVPEGMKPGALELSRRIERDTDAHAYVDGELCYGACDHAGVRARLLGVDAVIHLGHSDIPHMESDCSVPVHFFPASMKLETVPLVRGINEVLDRERGVRLGLATTVQHLGTLNKARDLLEKRGRKAFIGKPGRREMFPGQVLGCSFASARSIFHDVDAFVYIGTGRFHPIGLVNSVRKPVWAVDPMTGEVNRFGQDDLDQFLRKRWAAIASVKTSIEKGHNVGIVVGTKPGQMRMGLAEKMLDECRQKGMPSSMVVMDHVDPMKLRSLGIAVAVITACPRIAYDDISRYQQEGVVVITSNELMIATGEEEWEKYRFDEEW
ncbi:MAG: diphthamide biosynthesis enzyme Dph2 [Thermoplasmatota archaeon]